jgi:hypothetical protein
MAGLFFVGYPRCDSGSRVHRLPEHLPRRPRDHGVASRYGLHAREGLTPLCLSALLPDRGRKLGPSRELKFVKVFRCEPSAKYDRVGQAAYQRQVRFWQALAAVTPVDVLTQVLRGELRRDRRTVRTGARREGSLTSWSPPVWRRLPYGAGMEVLGAECWNTTVVAVEVPPHR